MISVHSTPEKLKKKNNNNNNHAAILDLCLRKTPTGKSHDYRDVIVFEKLRFQNVFCARENEKPQRFQLIDRV